MQAVRKAASSQHQLPWPSWGVKNARKPQKRRVSPFYAFLLVFLSLALAVIINVSQQALIVEKSLRAERLRRVIQAEQIRQEKLSIEVMRLKSPPNIENRARKQLGMIIPTETIYIKLPDKPVLAEKSTTPFSKNQPPRFRGLKIIQTLTRGVSTLMVRFFK